MYIHMNIHTYPFAFIVIIRINDSVLINLGMFFSENWYECNGCVLLLRNHSIIPGIVSIFWRIYIDLVNEYVSSVSKSLRHFARCSLFRLPALWCVKDKKYEREWRRHWTLTQKALQYAKPQDPHSS